MNVQRMHERRKEGTSDGGQSAFCYSTTRLHPLIRLRLIEEIFHQPLVCGSHKRIFVMGNSENTSQMYEERFITDYTHRLK